MSKELSSTKPYFIRALYDWVVDNGLTPQVLVAVDESGAVRVPREHVDDGRIVLNLSPSAVRGLELGNDEISFEARFRGVPRGVSFPVTAVLAIFARENGQGMTFPDAVSEGAEDATSAPAPARPAFEATGARDDDGEPDDEPPLPPGGKRKAPRLRVVK